MISIQQPLGQGQPPPPPAAEMFVLSLVNRYLSYAIGRTQAGLYIAAPLDVQENRLRLASARHFRSYSRMKARWLALAARRRRTPPPKPTPPPKATPIQDRLSRLLNVYLRSVLSASEAARLENASFAIRERRLFQASPRQFAFYIRLKTHMAAVAEEGREEPATPAEAARPDPTPPAPPPAAMFLHQMVERHLKYAIGSTKARAMRNDPLATKEAALQRASARRYRSYTRSKARWLRLAARRR